MSWLKDILEENRKVVDSWPAWKKVRWKMYREKLEQDNGSVDLADIPLLIAEYQQALAEKDREIADLKRAYTQELGRHKDTIHDLIVRQAADSAAYQQLMEQAVLFATWLRQFVDHEADEAQDADAFLGSPEAQAFLKEREHE